MCGAVGAKRRDPNGSWQTTKANQHVEVYTEIDEMTRAEMLVKTIEAKKEGGRLGLQRSASVPTPMKQKNGEVLFSGGGGSLEPSPVDAAEVAIARMVLYGGTPLPDRFVEDPHAREAFRQIYNAGYKAGVNGNLDSPVPSLTARALDQYAVAEFKLLQAYGHHIANVLDDHCGGNAATQCQADIVTLGDHRPYLSHGTHYTDPRSGIPLAVASGFSRMDGGKSNAQCADRMNLQAYAFFGRPQTSMAHSYVSDGGARGVVTLLNECGADMPPAALQSKPVLSGKVCMMHEASKVVSFANGTCGYKDGRGGDLWKMKSLDDFRNEFADMERQFRTKEDAVSLQLTASTRVTGGCPNIRFKSNFNTTRCAGEVAQHSTRP